MNKKQLSIFLSKLKKFDKPDVKLEQYPTDSEIASEILWAAYFNKDISSKVIADLGCGSGIFGIGALILGAKKVYFVEKDPKVMEVLRSNLKLIEFKNYQVINKDIKDFNKKVDVIMQNPPFGTRDKHLDKKFLEKAMEISDVIYSIHKITSVNFIKALAEDNGFNSKLILKFKLPLKNTLRFHKKPVYNVEAGCWNLNRKL